MSEKKEKEHKLQERICVYLSQLCNHHNFAFMSIPNEFLITACMMFAKGDSKGFGLLAKAKRMGMTNGASDLLITKDGKCWFIEIKAEGQKQKQNQIYFENWIKTTGGKYEVFDNFDDFDKYFKKEIIYGGFNV